jgi:hypothetical protein
MGIFAELRRFVLAYRACRELRCDGGSGQARRNREVKRVRAIVTAAHRARDFPSSGRRSAPRSGRGDAARANFSNRLASSGAFESRSSSSFFWPSSSDI